MRDRTEPNGNSPHTLFNYVYRDAGNFKAHGSVLLSGSLSQQQQAEIVARMESQEFFIAEQIGVKPLYEALYAFSVGMTREDHVWHCFEGFEEVCTDDQIEDQTCWGNANELHRRFQNVDSWSLRLSPHWAAAA